MYRYAYGAEDLLRLRRTCDEYDDAYVMFNNLSMHDDARRFLDLARSLRGPGDDGRA
jgi:uncharacterized protein YecE (DUF72 family)